MKRMTRNVSGLALAVVSAVVLAATAQGADEPQPAPLKIATTVRVVEKLGKGQVGPRWQPPPHSKLVLLCFHPPADRFAPTSAVLGALLRPTVDEAALDSFVSTRSRLEDGPESAWRAMELVTPANATRSSLEGLDFVHGPTKDVIGPNLDQLVKAAGGGWWKRVKRGYLLCLRADVPAESLTFTDPKMRFPPLVLYSTDLEHSCQFLGLLIEKPITILARNPLQAVEGRDWFTNEPKEQCHFRTEKDLSSEELVAELAAFHGCAAHKTETGFVIRDPTPDEMRESIRQVLEKFRKQGLTLDVSPRTISIISQEGSIQAQSDKEKQEGNWLTPDYPPGLPFSFQNGAMELASHLNDGDADVVRGVLWILWELHQGVGREELLRLIKSGKTSSGNPLKDDDMELVGRNLALLGDEAALPSLAKMAARADCVYEAILLASRIRTKSAAEFQARVAHEESPIVSPLVLGQVSVEGLPEHVSPEEANTLVGLAVDVAKNVLPYEPSEPRSHSHARATLSIAREGDAARYYLAVRYSERPLITGADYYTVEFHKYDGVWLVTAARRENESRPAYWAY